MSSFKRIYIISFKGIYILVPLKGYILASLKGYILVPLKGYILIPKKGNIYQRRNVDALPGPHPPGEPPGVSVIIITSCNSNQITCAHLVKAPRKLNGHRKTGNNRSDAKAVDVRSERKHPLTTHHFPTMVKRF